MNTANTTTTRRLRWTATHLDSLLSCSSHLQRMDTTAGQEENGGLATDHTLRMFTNTLLTGAGASLRRRSPSDGACRNVPSAAGGLSRQRTCPRWPRCAGTPPPTTWICPSPGSRCWRTGRPRATAPEPETRACARVAAEDTGEDRDHSI